MVACERAYAHNAASLIGYHARGLVRRVPE
jgi:hypothetical protein